MSITKYDVAEREIVAAVKLLFDSGDAIPIYVLANSAREIATTLCEKRGVHSIVDWIQDDRPHMTRVDIHREASSHAAFFKHADRDPDAVLEDFDPTEADAVLYMACADFRNLGRPLPVEGDAFDLWFMAVRGVLDNLPLPHLEGLAGIDKVPRAEQIAMGKWFLDAARASVGHRCVGAGK
jgi:hypothetical protein